MYIFRAKGLKQGFINLQKASPLLLGSFQHLYSTYDYTRIGTRWKSMNRLENTDECTRFIKKPTNALEFMNAILLHINLSHISDTHVVIMRVLRTKIQIQLWRVKNLHLVTHFFNLAAELYQSYSLRMSLWGPKHVAVI